MWNLGDIWLLRRLLNFAFTLHKPSTYKRKKYVFFVILKNKYSTKFNYWLIIASPNFNKFNNWMLKRFQKKSLLACETQSSELNFVHLTFSKKSISLCIKLSERTFRHLYEPVPSKLFPNNLMPNKFPYQ